MRREDTRLNKEVVDCITTGRKKGGKPKPTGKNVTLA
jgi:hypothetical protein